jgi:hypothetical protein
MMVFWVLMACRLVGRYQDFGGTYYPEDGGSMFL